MATDMLTSLVNSFGAPALDSLGKRLGLPPSVVKAATPMVIGLVLTGIRRLANQPGGMDSLGALLQDNSQRVGDRNLNAFLQEANPAKTEQTLDALTGSNAFDQVAANFARRLHLRMKLELIVLGKRWERLRQHTQLDIPADVEFFLHPIFLRVDDVISLLELVQMVLTLHLGPNPRFDNSRRYGLGDVICSP